MNASLSMLHGEILQLYVLQALVFFTPFTLGEMSSVITQNENTGPFLPVFAVSFTLNIGVKVI